MLKTFEKFYAVIGLLFLAGGLIPTEIAQGEQDPAYIHSQIIGQVCVFSIIAVLLLVRWRSVLRGVTAAAWPLLLCGLAILSTEWSLDHMFTLRRGIILLATTLFAVYLASHFDWEEQLDAFGWMTVVAVFGSYVLIVFFPDYGVSHDLHWGNWKGLFPHKNLLGLYMAFGILLMVFGRPGGLPKWLRIATLLGAIGLLVFSGSATALVSLLVCFALYPLVYLFGLRGKRTLPLWVPMLPLFISAGLFALLNSSRLLELLGRDSTFTGRADLWRIAISAIHDDPWLGHGYSIFWHTVTTESTGVLISATTHAHDGYLDLCIDLGFVGLLVFVIGFLLFAKRAFTMLSNKSTAASKWPLIFLTLFATYNIAESSLLRTHTFMWIPFVSIYTALALMPSEARVEVTEPEMVPEYSA
jgi:exopolysaccharide production protein ExoQ